MISFTSVYTSGTVPLDVPVVDDCDGVVDDARNHLDKTIPITVSSQDLKMKSNLSQKSFALDL